MASRGTPRVPQPVMGSRLLRPDAVSDWPGELGLLRSQPCLLFDLGNGGVLKVALGGLSIVGLAAVAGVLLTLSACGTGAEDKAPDSPNDTPSTDAEVPAGNDTQAAGSIVRIESGSPPVWFAKSLRTMLERYQTIIVGRVEGVREIRNLDALGATPRMESTPPKFPETVFDVKVLEVIAASRVSRGETIGFYQLGAAIGDDMTNQTGVNPFVTIGATYLFVLRDLQPEFGLDEFTNSAFGRFVITPNRLIVPNGWEGLPGVSAVSGVPYAEVEQALYSGNPDDARAALARRTVDEAAVDIAAAIALAPLPALPTRIPFVTATPQPTAEEPITTPSPIEITTPVPTPAGTGTPPGATSGASP